jgi:hypothetical protein
MNIQVIDKETGKMVWTEEHRTKELAYNAIEQLKKNNFNPNFFKFTIK